METVPAGLATLLEQLAQLPAVLLPGELLTIHLDNQVQSRKYSTAHYPPGQSGTVQTLQYSTVLLTVHLDSQVQYRQYSTVQHCSLSTWKVRYSTDSTLQYRTAHCPPGVLDSEVQYRQ